MAWEEEEKSSLVWILFYPVCCSGVLGGGRCVSDLSAGRVRRGAGEAECSDIDTGGPRSKVGKIVGMGGLGWLRRVSRIGERGTLLIVHVML